MKNGNIVQNSPQQDAWVREDCEKDAPHGIIGIKYAHIFISMRVLSYT